MILRFMSCRVDLLLKHETPAVLQFSHTQLYLGNLVNIVGQFETLTHQNYRFLLI